MRGSRFRSAADPGVFYGARERRTACAELGYWRWRFLNDSPGLTHIGPVAQTVFQANVEAPAVDLRQKPFSRDARDWTHAESYEAAQAFARTAREARVGLILYGSVRDPERGECGVLLTPRGFAPPRRPLVEQTRFLTVTESASAWQREGERYEFSWR
ncbi:MAG TPA: RES family NAD+ phosphorylase [Burkholderiales bacterium]|nr:RES family NAD+ phosphorylase [Burkholderiales bacterium]